MARGVDRNTLKTEWNSCKKKNWYSIYQWERTSGRKYTEWIAEWIEESIENITLDVAGLRQRSFHKEDHRGQISPRADVNRVAEKHLVRAMFNRSMVPIMGKVIDYEVPLKETEEAKHGDIDLLCIESPHAFCVEAKSHDSGESVLKAILQAFTYTSLITTCRDRFLADFKLHTTSRLTPAVLTFADAQSGRQLQRIEKYPILSRLINRLNSKLGAPIRFFVVQNDVAELETWLTSEKQPNGDVKAVFCEGFELDIVECSIP